MNNNIIMHRKLHSIEKNIASDMMALTIVKLVSISSLVSVLASIKY